MALSLKAHKALDTPDCLLCLETLLENSPVTIMLPCAHVFHELCLKEKEKEKKMMEDFYSVRLKTELCPQCRE